ncbi:MAG: beta-lactamase family protein [Spirochaetes bacterium]|nr:beta-lactamase family protein [Spirochaetota bacterium]MBU1079246.1 beta-lactamase family protein [Spirochaetota bacterium]
MERLRTIIEDTAAGTGFSGVVSVSSRSGPAFRAAYGYRDRANGAVNGTDTRLAIASGTKLFTALGIGRLVQGGRLSVSTEVGELAPDFSAWIDPRATIGQLLTHSSGCYDYLDEEAMEDYDNFRLEIPWYDLATPSDYLPLFQGRPSKFAPGERYSYSNGGYVALGILIERVSGSPYRDFIAAEVLAPAGMAGSGFFAFDELPADVASGYLGDGLATNVYKVPVRGGGDGGMYTTAADLDALWRSLFSGRILAEGLLEDWLAPKIDISERSSYAYGLYLRKKDGSYFIVGGDHGVGFDSRYLPDRDLVVSILSNESDGEEAMRDAILGALDDGAL